ncbi:hypothetical protein NZD89_04240 [Alicyclobacillus fastidiosus]|uniref:Uncharacterized protein n=1 Tax=Alicyclobacillus fastidiosus TaxID=392011 RepID=A0ABY6ZKP6_9BACL|nr:hypothetical protein [Alicyclobacillus fastidiosus]WAH42659.1 hypothetical protein NZD89_04240 [Alicyclobacillus fastidiosus]GMA64535.1 hypothetical protein GCM10025859_49750 [Alicyclobacillus fastidiosus]
MERENTTHRIQRTPITQKQWRANWRKRYEWYVQQQWDAKPTVVLVNVTGQKEDTIHPPKGTVVCRTVDDVRRALRSQG